MLNSASRPKEPLGSQFSWLLSGAFTRGKAAMSDNTSILHYCEMGEENERAPE